MMDSSPSKVNMRPSVPATAGVKRPAPSLLPAFEPFSSSPALPRPSKRKTFASPYQKYPTPVPTSTTGILSSSPPPLQNGRPNLQRTQSALSERTPLSSVPTIVVPYSGEELLMGRSSNSSHVQLSANTLISRVHIKARYIPATETLEPEKMEIICCGWNGVKVHCHGQTWDLAKGDSFTSATESAEIMLDVQDARVIIAWPELPRTADSTRIVDSSWDDDDSPSDSPRDSPRVRVSAVDAEGRILQSSPLQNNHRLEHRLVSPESPTPAGPPTGSFAGLLDRENSKPMVQIYEDESSSDQNQEASQVSQTSEPPTQVASQPPGLDASQSSDLSEPDDGDPDEENDPIVHSFGPFGANISSRMASFTAGSSPLRSRKRGSPEIFLSPANRSSSELTNDADALPVVNHVINQLAFSRLSSTPLSAILNSLPASLKGISPSCAENQGLTRDDLQKLLIATPCIGKIHREGKDAAGIPLESEFYYIPDEDRDVQRKAAVVDGLRKPSLRNCRKQHKQYYWKKPKTP